ncbi:MAG TPA: DUF2269 family protein [Candidatus Baltobacteraceae bacterium]
MLQTLLFFHVLAVIGLFTGITLDVIAVVRVNRAVTLNEVRAALLNVPLVGPIMMSSVLLLLAAGISLIYAGHFGWTPGWIDVVFVLTVILTVLGPAVTGRKGEALHTLAEQAGEGAIPPAIDAARRDRVLGYMVFMSLLELVAALYIMVTKPELLTAVAAAICAAVVAAIPAALVSRRNPAAAPAET